MPAALLCSCGVRVSSAFPRGALATRTLRPEQVLAWRVRLPAWDGTGRQMQGQQGVPVALSGVGIRVGFYVLLKTLSI